jgi:tetratricopeptide (TPR) repeat protein
LSDDPKKPKLPPPPKGGPGSEDPSAQDGNKRPELSVDQESPAIGLKEAPIGAAANGKGIRSPIVNTTPGTTNPGTKEPAPAKSESPKSDKVVRRGEGEAKSRQPISKHKSRPAADSAISLIASHHIMTDNYSSKRRFMIWSLALGMIGAMALSYLYIPAVQNMVESVADDVNGKMNASEKRAKRLQTQRKRKARSQKASKKMAARSLELADSQCRNIIRAGFQHSDPSKMAADDRIRLAECQIIYSDFDNAVRTLSVDRQKLNNMSVKKYATSKMTRPFFLLLINSLKAGKFIQADQIVGSRCRGWSETEYCVGKLLTLAYRKLTNSGVTGYTKMKAVQTGKLSKEARGWFHLAAGRLYEQQGNTRNADSFYKLALNYAPKKSLVLRKEVYETHAVSLYHRGSLIRLKQTVHSALKGLKTVERKAKVKLILLAELSKPKTAKKFLRRFLNRPEVALRVRGDVELIDVIGPEAMKHRLYKEYTRFLKNALDRLLASKASKGNLKLVSQWDIRSAYAQASYPTKILAKLKRYRMRFGEDDFVSHMYGSAYLSGDDARNNAQKSMVHFQQAVKKGKSWESLVGLGIAMIRSGRPEEVNGIIKDLNKSITRDGKAYWIDMLKAEWYMSTKRFPQAYQTLVDWQQKEPDYVTPHKLMQKYYKIQGKIEGAQESRLKVEKMLQEGHYASSREGTSSPLGHMALGNRPLN